MQGASVPKNTSPGQYLLGKMLISPKIKTFSRRILQFCILLARNEKRKKVFHLLSSGRIVTFWNSIQYCGISDIVFVTRNRILTFIVRFWRRAFYSSLKNNKGKTLFNSMIMLRGSLAITESIGGKEITFMYFPGPPHPLYRTKQKTMWGILAREIYQNQRTYAFKEQIEKCISYTWNRIRRSFVTNLSKFLLNCYTDVIGKKEKTTNYQYLLKVTNKYCYVTYFSSEVGSMLLLRRKIVVRRSIIFKDTA